MVVLIERHGVGDIMDRGSTLRGLGQHIRDIGPYEDRQVLCNHEGEAICGIKRFIGGDSIGEPREVPLEDLVLEEHRNHRNALKRFVLIEATLIDLTLQELK